MSATEVLGYVQSLINSWGIAGALQAAVVIIVAFVFLSSLRNVFK